MNARTLRVVEIVGLVILGAGIIFWYGTPDDVTTGPMIVMVAGGVVAGIAWLVRRQQADESVTDLANRVRTERERDTQGRGQ